MRTRFLNTDYFTISPSPSETLSFLNLQPPRLPPSNLPSFSGDLLHFDPLLYDVPLQAEKLPIDAALSKFLSDSIPQFIDVDFRYFEDTQPPSGNFGAKLSEEEAMVCNEEKEVESQNIVGSENLEKDNVTSFNDKNQERFDVILFETPELYAFLDNAHFNEEELAPFSAVREIDKNQDESESTVPYSTKIQQSVYSVENVTSVYSIEQNNCTLEEDISFGDQVQHSMFPFLEVDELSLGIMTSHSMDDVLPSVFEYIESQLWTQENNVLIDSRELLGSIGQDILNFLSDHCLSEQCPKPELAFPEMFLEMNLICMVEAPQFDGSSEFFMAKQDTDYVLPMNLDIFEEFQVFDIDSSNILEVFLNRQMAHDLDAFNHDFREDMNLKSFNELVVSHELALVDATFKSLPVPVLSDNGGMRSICTVVDKLLSGLKPLPLSASNGIYLDWFILEEDKCNPKVYSLFQKMVEETDSCKCNIDFDQETFEDGKLVSDFIFSDDTLSELATEQHEETVKISSSSWNGHLPDDLSGNLQDNEFRIPGNTEQLAEKDSKRASLLFKSTSQFNDLDFFLNPQKGSAGVNAGPAAVLFDPIATLPNVSSGHSVEACTSTGVQSQQWDVINYKIKLSDDMMALIENFEKSYLAILQNETELISFLTADNLELLSLPKQKLMDCIKKKMARRMTSHKDEDVMPFVTLCAIKQMAWYMCFYGIHVAHFYVDKLCLSLGCMHSRLSFLHSLIEEARGNVNKEITRSHPALCIIKGILQSNTSPSSFKVLILAEQVFWWSLKSLLLSIGLSWTEVSTFCTTSNSSDAYKMDSQLISDCWLVSQENVSASFPFNKFNLILEYGGSCGSSRVSSFSPNLSGVTHLHFLKIELDGSSASKALCDGVYMPQNMKKLMEGEFHSNLAIDDNVNYQKLEDILNYVPVEDKNVQSSLRNVDITEPPCVPLPVAVETKQPQQSMADIVIIVNTQNFDKEMIVSRRSTYQKILAMEKKGAQVVERDSNLPVDVIISSAICLVWYDCINIGRKAATLDEASSCLPSCIENIATNILTLLSFSFSGCFLVFEGDIGFLSTVMESSAGLYAAAATLGIDFQLFCSYSSELTDEIILNCIDYAAKMTGGLYPKMPDSETLAESFLTKFPSINPLTAHAILSSGGTLIEFLEWSHERRINAVQNYCVPDESIALFSALCKYGEREDTKSVMTDCSSSVSSGQDSDKCHLNVGSEGKYIKSSHKMNIGMDELLHFEPFNKCTDDFLNPSGLLKPYDSLKSKGSEIFQDYEMRSSSLNDVFDQKHEFEFPKLLSSQVPDVYDSHVTEGPERLNEAKKPKLNVPLKDNTWNYNQGENMVMLNTLDWQNMNSFENQHKNLVGEVIDLTDSPTFGEDVSCFGNSIPFSSSVPENEKDSTRKSKIARRLSFGKGGRTVLPYVSEINTGPDIFGSVKYPRESLQGTNDNLDTGYRDKLQPRNQENPIRDVLAQGSAACRVSLLKKDVSNHSETPLSKAILSAHPQTDSPWTIEFLNRIREKSRLRQQNLPSDTSASPFEISGNITNVRKRRSPSILDFFKYQGGSTPRKILDQRKQKGYLQPSSSSKKEKASSSLPQTRTPIDKRARQTLSFAMNESGSQTKLVWSDGGAHGMRKKPRNYN
ncbi:hypothetical protein CCACVL1_05153 [Corchorus capsularis]|uniref:Protein SHORTAGE IN CHIASMATA 1 n=1 Tax=Corchorus capsularis TaxID=210143 RepID=A0A1R3JM55_COCAP|nr:hypothetical protein CCACVL1_05153 [Corchorus capsularis]